VPRSALDPEIEAFNAAAQDPSNFIENDTLPLDARGADGQPVSCDPGALEAQFGRDSAERRNCVVSPFAYIVDGVQRNLNDTNAGLITLVLPAINAGDLEVQGIDIKADYSWDTDWGQFRVGLNYTHVDEYLVKNVPGLDLGLQSTGQFDAAGTDGDSPIVNSLPDNKGTLSFNWSNGAHGVSVFNRHIGSYQILGHRDYVDNPQRTQLDLAYAKPKVDSYNTWDLQYNYNHQWANEDFGSTILTLGIIDAFNADIPLYRRSTFDSSVFDGRGRRLYARALWQF
jgi:hypothetical protein